MIQQKIFSHNAARNAARNAAIPSGFRIFFSLLRSFLPCLLPFFLPSACFLPAFLPSPPSVPSLQDPYLFFWCLLFVFFVDAYYHFFLMRIRLFFGWELGCIMSRGSFLAKIGARNIRTVAGIIVWVMYLGNIYKKVKKDGHREHIRNTYSGKIIAVLPLRIPKILWNVQPPWVVSGIEVPGRILCQSLYLQMGEGQFVSKALPKQKMLRAKINQKLATALFF